MILYYASPRANTTYLWISSLVLLCLIPPRFWKLRSWHIMEMSYTGEGEKAQLFPGHPWRKGQGNGKNDPVRTFLYDRVKKVGTTNGKCHLDPNIMNLREVSICSCSNLCLSHTLSYSCPWHGAAVASLVFSLNGLSFYNLIYLKRKILKPQI